MSGTILVVDDSGLARRSARRIEAEDGMSALEQYFVRKPGVVVLDLVMKGMYGLDVLTKLREIDGNARVIVLSADIQTSSKDLVETGGAFAFINKPVQAAELLSAVENAIREGQ
jgi:two-component system chemotaxis response regulator CheY